MTENNLPPYFKYIGSRKNELWYFKCLKDGKNSYIEPSEKDLSSNTFENYKIFEKKFGNLKVILKTKDPFIKNVNALLNQLIFAIELEFL